MRRTDREVKDEKRIRELIELCDCCRLGFCDEGKVYIVPLSFGYEDNKKTFYFHGAKKGKKIDLIEKTHRAGFELDTNYALVKGENACSYSAKYSSIIGNGKVTVLTDEEEKIAGLKSIMKHNTGRSDWEFKSEMLKGVCVFKLEVEEMSCKEHL